MQPIHHFAGGVLARPDPPPAAVSGADGVRLATGGRTGAGACHHRRAQQGVLHVSATDPRWLKEIDRARGAILSKLQQLLGPAAVYEDHDLMKQSVILSAVRTPTGKFLGALKEFTATQLGAMAVREAVARAGIDPASRSTNASWATSSRRATARIPRARRR